MWYMRDSSGTLTLVAACGEDEERAKLRLTGLVAAADPEHPERFEAVLVIEGERTTDLREIAPQALTWRELPIPLTNAEDTGDDHYGAVVGAIEEVTRVSVSDGRFEVRGRGAFDMGSEAGMEASRLCGNQMKRWVSIDLEIITAEFTPVNASCDDTSSDPDDWCEYVMRVLEGRIMGAAQCAFPAFPGAVIVPEGVSIPAGDEDGRPAAEVDEGLAASVATLVDGTGAPMDVPAGDLETDLARPLPLTLPRLGLAVPRGIVAHASKAAPPAAVFNKPSVEGLTHLTITDDGSVFAHVAGFSSCHVGYPNVCLTAPRSKSDYAYFRTGEVVTAEGSKIATGPLILGTDHAALNLGASSAVDHYAHTGAAVADVAIGEDEYGIWIAGALRPGLSDEQIAVLRASSISGDWRKINGNLELVAILVVNTPGFPVPRARVASGQQVSLVAAGSVPPCDCEDLDAKVSELMAEVPKPIERLFAGVKQKA